jgi:hypothetical protein
MADAQLGLKGLHILDGEQTSDELIRGDDCRCSAALPQVRHPGAGARPLPGALPRSAVLRHAAAPDLEAPALAVPEPISPTPYAPGCRRRSITQLGWRTRST